jgi:hypothetical protein
LIRETETSKELFGLMKEFAMAKSKRIGVTTLDFWDEFHDTITNQIDDLKSYEHLFKQYLEMV